MYFRDWNALRSLRPRENGAWDKEILEEYLIQCCDRRFTAFIDTFLAEYQGDEALAELLLDFLLNDDYDGSDSQMGAARYIIAGMDRAVLKRKKDLLIQAQKSEVFWKRPFQNDEYLAWL